MALRGKAWESSIPSFTVGYQPPLRSRSPSPYRIPKAEMGSGGVRLKNSTRYVLNNHLGDGDEGHERSPYLRSHAKNKVEWWPWGEEAIEKAKKENKMIFLSSGYSTCHWCHVMSHESFDDEETASLLNSSFVSIKLDREEHPAVDALYMSFVQASTGRGGWPLSVFLTPSLAPFYGGSYFPPGYGESAPVPRFCSLLQQLVGAWSKPEAREILERGGERALSVLKAQDVHGKNTIPEEGQPMITHVMLRGILSLVEECGGELTRRFDAQYGGFGTAPKFPRVSELRFLLNESRFMERSQYGEKCREIALKTIDAIMNGGIYDHVGGGFHRYSVDRRWHVPHFEKMAYDQAQNMALLLDAYQLTKDKRYAQCVRETADYVLRYMTHPEGGFYTAEDADSWEHQDEKHAENVKKEGAFYVWKYEEVLDALDGMKKENVELVCAAFGIEEEGNVLRDSDPHAEFVGENVVYRAADSVQLAKSYGIPEREVDDVLRVAKEKMCAWRSENRVRPFMDEKVLATINGLMISAFARAGRVLHEPRYLDAAEAAAKFAMDRLTSGDDLLQIWNDKSSAKEIATASGYAFMIAGVLDLYEATLVSAGWVLWAIELCDRANELFLDKGVENERWDGAYFESKEDPKLRFRQVVSFDGAEPTASSVMIMNLVRLSEIAGAPLRQRAAETAFAFRHYLEKSPLSMPLLLSAIRMVLDPSRHVALVRLETIRDEGFQKMLDILHEEFVPHKTIMLAQHASTFATALEDHKELGSHGSEWSNSGSLEETSTHRIALDSPTSMGQMTALTPVRNQPTVFLCQNRVCLPPITQPRKLREIWSTHEC